MDLSKFTNLKYLNCSDNNITRLILSDSLIDINCNYNNIYEMNFPINARTLLFEANNIKGKLDFSNYDNLRILKCCIN